MREIDPFAYFADNASAIVGLGGNLAHPDPLYCFHTQYEPVRAGTAIFHVRLVAAHATVGEMTFRVHAYKPGGTGDIALAGGGKVALAGRRGDDVEVPVRFGAVEGVQYALYGYFSESSDLAVAALRIELDESAPDATVSPRDVSARSLHARGDLSTSARLLSDRAPSLAFPVSQVCTRAQIDDPLLASDKRFASLDPLRGWMILAPLRALETAGLLAGGVRGLLVEPVEPALHDALVTAGCQIQLRTERDAPKAAFDFLISYACFNPAWSARKRSSHINAMLAFLLRDATAIFVLPFRTDETQKPKDGADENEIKQIALRLIGRSCSVAQMAFPRDPWCDDDGSSAFVLIVRNTL